MEVYTGMVTFDWGMIVWFLLYFCIGIFLLYLVIANLWYGRKLLKKKCEDEGLVEKKENSTFLVKKEDRK